VANRLVFMSFVYINNKSIDYIDGFESIGILPARFFERAESNLR